MHENTDNKANKKKHDETDLKTSPEHNIKENTVHDLNQNVPKLNKMYKKVKSVDKIGTQNENKAVIDSTQSQQGNRKELPDCHKENLKLY